MELPERDGDGYLTDMNAWTPEIGQAMADADENVVTVNSAFESLFGYSRAEVAGKLINDLITPPERIESKKPPTSAPTPTAMLSHSYPRDPTCQTFSANTGSSWTS